MATYMGDDRRRGFMGRVFQHWSLWCKRSSVHSLPSNTYEKPITKNKLILKAPNRQTNTVEDTKPRHERAVSEKQIGKVTLATARPSISQNGNQGRGLSDGARSSNITSSSFNSSTGKKENLVEEKQSSVNQGGLSSELNRISTTQPQTGGILRASSGNILQLAQMGSLKQLANGSPSAMYLHGNTATKSLESNVTMGNILRRNSGEINLQGSMNKLDSEQLKLMGNDKYRQGKYEEALALYDQTIAIDSNRAIYRSNKSAALAALGRILEAVSECREAIRTDPLHQQAHHRIATLYFRLGYAQEALDHFNLSGCITNIQGITQAKALQACLSKCTEAEKLNDWVTVLRETHDAISIGANSSLQIYALQAQALLKLHKHDEAYASFKCRPNYEMDAYTHLFGKTRSNYLYLIEAKVYMATGRFEEAIRAAQTAARLDPTNKDVRDILIRARSVAMARSKGNKFFKELKFSEACRTYSEGLEYDSYNSVLLCNRAACHTKLGKFEKAMEDCNLALALRPSYSKARLRRAHCNAKLERWEASIRDYEMLIMERPGDEEVGQALFEARIQLKKGRGEDVKDMKFGSDVVSIPSVDCFRHLITSPGMSVVLFCDKSSQEKAMRLLEQVCQKFPSINFLKVEVEGHPYLAKSEEVTYIPAFKIYKNGSKIKEIPGYNPQLLENSVKLHSS